MSGPLLAPDLKVGFVMLDEHDCAALVGPLSVLSSKPGVAGTDRGQRYARIADDCSLVARAVTKRQANRENDNLSPAGFDSEPASQMLGTADVVAFTGCSRRTAQRWCREMGRKVKGRWVITQEQAEMMRVR